MNLEGEKKGRAQPLPLTVKQTNKQTNNILVIPAHQLWINFSGSPSNKMNFKNHKSLS